MANEIPVSVSVDDGTITIRVPLSLLRGRSRRVAHTAKHPDWTILNKTRGMWRHRRVDGLTYQRHIRSEWNRSPER